MESAQNGLVSSSFETVLSSFFLFWLFLYPSFSLSIFSLSFLSLSLFSFIFFFFLLLGSQRYYPTITAGSSTFLPFGLSHWVSSPPNFAISIMQHNYANWIQTKFSLWALGVSPYRRDWKSTESEVFLARFGLLENKTRWHSGGKVFYVSPRGCGESYTPID